MKKQSIEKWPEYPEQYELYEKNAIGPLSRRDFFKYMGGGVASFLVFSDVMASQVVEQMDIWERSWADENIAAWIHINEVGKITVFTGKVEVGQNIRTSLAQIVAEELFVPVDAIHMVMGDTDLTPYDRGTYGSLSTPQMGPQLRKAAASVRELLKAEVSKEWDLGETPVRLEKGFVYHPSNGKRYSYAELTKGKKLLQPVDEQVGIISPEKWKIAGTSVPKVNGRDFITGKHQYVSDLKLPNMVYGKVLRPPAYGASLVKVNTSKAEKLPGVSVVREGDFIAVTAPDNRTAAMALAMIAVEWKKDEQISDKELFQHLKKHGGEQGQKAAVTDAFLAAAQQLDQVFKVDYIAHVPMEPRAGVAKWDGDRLTVWTGTQRPFGVQEELQRQFKIPKERIRVIMPDTGSGYGGKHTGEAGIEAARIAKVVGKPVKVCWTREEEFKWAYFRPAGLIEVRSSLDQKGQLLSWEFHNYNSGNAGIDVPYESGVKDVQFHRSQSPLRQGSYRALASTANIFAIESQINDMAVLAGKDPLEFRIQHLRDERLKAVLEATASSFRWDRPRERGSGFGIACGAVKGGFVATCAEVQVQPNSRELKVVRLTVGFECGAIINPRHLKGQVVGCVVQGLGGALFESVAFNNGEILNPSLASYRVPRFRDVSGIEVVLLDRKDLPSSGAGEAPIVGVAPAIRNAVFDAVGVKLNQLPMIPNGLVPVSS